MAFPKYKTHEIAFVEFIVNDDEYALFDPDDNLVATLKRHEYLSQPQLRRIGNSNGRHRKTSSKIRNSPIGKPSFTVSVGTLVPFTVSIISYERADEPIQDAGIRAGEITGRRAWWRMGNKLFSIYMTSCEWFPGVPVIGDVSSGYGVHSFKEATHLIDYAMSVWFLSSPQFASSLVTGTVSMWGEIVEHERGYRAQYAKIISLDTKDEDLKKRYGV